MTQILLPLKMFFEMVEKNDCETLKSFEKTVDLGVKGGLCGINQGRDSAI